MLEVRLDSGAVVAFDGRVLEVFDAGGESHRFHIARLPIPRLVEGPDGSSKIELGTRDLMLDLVGSETSACRRLIAAIEQARAADEAGG
jgi:hypothetical protein